MRDALVGFMQGRLSPPIDGRIQAFPAATWREEFPAARALGFSCMEWTLDQDGLYSNPLMTVEGRAEIREWTRRTGVQVPAVTADCFMQAPFWTATDSSDRAARERDFIAVVEACAALHVDVLVVPLVDNGRLQNDEQTRVLCGFLHDHRAHWSRAGVRLAFECDLPPLPAARLLERIDPAWGGLNYDIGNSASLGFDPTEEWQTYGDRVIHLHVKDRLRGGTTVPLGTGAADFDAVFRAVRSAGYLGRFVLQTARAADGDHAGVLAAYRAMTLAWLESDSESHGR